MVTSAHKALPAYSQAAIVLARTERLNAARLDRAFEATHTTSPAGSIMASIDAARALLAKDGEELCARLLRLIAMAKDRLRQVPDVGVLDGPGVEPTKLVVLIAGTGTQGYTIEHDLIAARHAGRERRPRHRRPDHHAGRRRGARGRVPRRPHRLDRAASDHAAQAGRRRVLDGRT